MVNQDQHGMFYIGYKVLVNISKPTDNPKTEATRHQTSSSAHFWHTHIHTHTLCLHCGPAYASKSSVINRDPVGLLRISMWSYERSNYERMVCWMLLAKNVKHTQERNTRVIFSFSPPFCCRRLCLPFITGTDTVWNLTRLRISLLKLAFTKIPSFYALICLGKFRINVTRVEWTETSDIDLRIREKQAQPIL